MDSALKMFFGLFAFVLGLQGLFRLAAYGPKSSRQDRVKEAVLSTGHLLVGVAVLAASTALSLPFGLGALACLLAVTLRRPRRVFAAS